MNLLCPHCRKTVEIPDSLAGQTTKCPQCQGPFTAPLTQTPPPPVPPAPPPVSAPVTGDQPASETPAPAPIPEGGYRRQLWLGIKPSFPFWVPIICYPLIFVLLFLPWVGIEMGDQTLVSRSGFGIAFGADIKSHERNPVLRVTSMFPQLSQVADLPMGVLVFFYIATILLCLVVVVFLLIIPSWFHSVLEHLPLAVERMVPNRSLVLGGLAFASLLFLLLQVFLSLPLENAVAERAEADYQTAMDSAAAKGDRESVTAQADAELERGLITSFLKRSGWFYLVVILNALALFAALIDFWLSRRGHRANPRIMMEW